MSKTKVTVSDINLGQYHVVQIGTIDYKKHAVISSDFTARQVNYYYKVKDGKVQCVDAVSL